MSSFLGVTTDVWAALGTWASAAATGFAALVALEGITTWRKQLYHQTAWDRLRAAVIALRGTLRAARHAAFLQFKLMESDQLTVQPEEYYSAQHALEEWVEELGSVGNEIAMFDGNEQAKPLRKAQAAASMFILPFRVALGWKSKPQWAEGSDALVDTFNAATTHLRQMEKRLRDDSSSLMGKVIRAAVSLPYEIDRVLSELERRQIEREERRSNSAQK